MSGYPENWESQLESGLNQMGLKLSQDQQQMLLEYLALLMKWNKTYNLTAIRDPEEMVPRQLLDSLSILPLIQGRRILDVGTGAGLPGIPLAICRPDASFTLLDSNGKKTRFVQQAKLELRLENLQVQHSRVEQLADEVGFNTITTRAFAALPKIVELTTGLMADRGILLAMKGTAPQEEMMLLRSAGCKVEIIPLEVPSSGERHAIIIHSAR
ncbi:MAG: 16S rRNA (guanine(527)-N(7))-methyltransferase RsmG [Gammaproteobacteria bacterium]|nr:16S rRNA (guanine(527)-N(7))-methyltransferase RsmG [Gammaproteobacteria bacterium]